MTQDIEKYVDEYGSKFYPTLGYNRYQEGADWLRATLTKVAEEARRVERERIIEWACTHNMPDNMPDDARAGYNEALIQLTTNLQSDK